MARSFPFRPSVEEGLRQPWRTLRRTETVHSYWLCPLVGPVGRKNRGRLAPYGGVVRPGRVDALRAIDPSPRPRSWRTCGPRRLRRQSKARAQPRNVCGTTVLL